MPTPRKSAWLVAAAFALEAGRASAEQDLGHKTLGTLGLKAGTQPEAGVYLAEQVVRYRATTVRDRNGNTIPVGLDLDATSGAFGVAATFQLPELDTYYNASIGFPVSRVTASTERPEASTDRFGLGDLYVKPVSLGWRMERLHVVTSYSFYAPTGGFVPGGNDGVGRGHWTHQLGLGSLVYFDEEKVLHLSALASFDLNQGKRHVDITRGATLQIQGGFGATVHRIVDVGVAAYALWQVTDDRGADLPDVLVGARDRAFGAGPELDVTIPPLRSRLIARYAHDFAVESRPQGAIFVLGLRVSLWK